MEQQEGKLKSLTIQEKLELIAIVESGRSVKDVAEEYAVNRNTLHYIFKNRDKIRDGVNAQPGISGFKRIKKTKCPELEKLVLDFMYESRAKGEKLSGSSIKAMALEFATELQVENFYASNGWLFAFFKRNQITISEFNRSVGPPNSTSPKVIETVRTITNEEIYDEDDQTDNSVIPKNEFEMVQIEEVTYDYNTNNNCSDLFETQIVQEEEEEEEAAREEVESDISWHNWCRMCGDCETLPELDVQITEIVQQLLYVSEILKFFTQIPSIYQNIFPDSTRGDH